MRFSIINHPFWGTPIFGNTHILPKLKVIYAILGVKNPYTFPPFFEFFGAEVSTFLGHFLAAAHLRKRPMTLGVNTTIPMGSMGLVYLYMIYLHENHRNQPFI